MAKQFFDLKTKKLDYKLLLDEVISSDKKEVNAMFFAQHDFSITNRVLAACQCHDQGFKFGLMKCMSKWTSDNRTKKINARKLWLRLPVNYKLYDKVTKKPLLDENGKQKFGQGFKFENHWLCYDQTEGAELDEKELLQIFDFDNCIKNLLIEKVEFDYDGECGGYAMTRKRKLAVNPAWHNANDVAKVIWHELGHIVLNHRSEQLPQEKELEAELVAMILAKILDVPCAEQGAYIKGWLQNNYELFTKDVHKRCFKAVELIIKASKSSEPVVEVDKDGNLVPIKNKK